MNFIVCNRLICNALQFVLLSIISIEAKSQEVLLPNQLKFDIPVINEPKPVVENVVQDVFVAVPVQNQILKGYLGKRITQNLEERLLKIDEKGIIEGYLHRPGNHPWI